MKGLRTFLAMAVFAVAATGCQTAPKSGSPVASPTHVFSTVAEVECTLHSPPARDGMQPGWTVSLPGERL